jgi:hypothetical protein
LYRFLAVAFEKTDLVLIDARKLATEHLGIVNVPKYLSRLMQTLEPACEQLIRTQVLSACHVVSADEWKIALHRHPQYMPESKLLLQAPEGEPELKRNYCAKLLERAGFTTNAAERYAAAAESNAQFYALERAARLVEAMKDEEVASQVALNTIRKAIDSDAVGGAGRDLLDACEIAIELCRERKRGSQDLRNPGGFLMKIVKDPETRARFASPEREAAFKQRFRQREEAALRQQQEAEERTLILEYERFRHSVAEKAFADLSDDERNGLRRMKRDVLKEQDRYERMSAEAREHELDELVLSDLAKEVPPFEKWYLRRRAQQALLPFDSDFAAQAAS